MIRTYVDSGVLIVAARGTNDAADPALDVLSDPQRVFLSSVFVQLEVVPKPAYFGRTDELALYNTFFQGVAEWANPDITGEALALARTYGLSALDALHVAAALALGAEELITTEKLSKPIHRVTELRVIGI